MIQATDERVMAAIFRQITINEDDVLVDVGCGDGDIIEHWLALGLKNRIVGIELDHGTMRETSARFQRYGTVEIIHGDASYGHDAGTLFYLFNPFRGEQMLRFEKSLRDRDVRIIYNAYHDLDIFDRWHIEKLRPAPDEYQYRAALLKPPRWSDLKATSVKNSNWF